VKRSLTLGMLCLFLMGAGGISLVPSGSKTKTTTIRRAVVRAEKIQAVVRAEKIRLREEAKIKIPSVDEEVTPTIILERVR